MLTRRGSAHSIGVSLIAVAVIGVPVVALADLALGFGVDGASSERSTSPNFIPTLPLPLCLGEAVNDADRAVCRRIAARQDAINAAHPPVTHPIPDELALLSSSEQQALSAAFQIACERGDLTPDLPADAYCQVVMRGSIRAAPNQRPTLALAEDELHQARRVCTTGPCLEGLARIEMIVKAVAAEHPFDPFARTHDGEPSR